MPIRAGDTALVADDGYASSHASDNLSIVQYITMLLGRAIYAVDSSTSTMPVQCKYRNVMRRYAMPAGGRYAMLP